jgi:hypothetical protein
MMPRVPRIGRLVVALLALVAGAGCAVEEYNPKPIAAESEALGEVTQLTTPTSVDGFERAGQGRLSPDGRWLEFRGMPRGDTSGFGLYLARVKWSGDRGASDRHIVGIDRPIRITRADVRCGGACFSPDGFALVFAAAAGPAPADPPAPMRLYRVDGWEQDVAMTDAARGIDLAQHTLTGTDLSADECDWSPDGKTIVFAATPTTGGGAIGVYAMRPDGSNVIRLGPPTGYGRGAMFSPDGHRLVYRGDAIGRLTAHGQPGSQIFVADVLLDANGTVVGLAHPKLLTNEPDAIASGPCWAGPDHLLYSTTRHGDANAELYVMDVNGMRKTRLTLTPGPDVLPSVSRDGQHLLWTRAGSSVGSPQLYAAELSLPPGS